MSVGWSVCPKKDMKINGVRAEYELPCTKASGGCPPPLGLNGRIKHSLHQSPYPPW